MSKEEYIEKALSWAKTKRISNIKSKLDDYDDPVHYNRKDEEDSFTPDITGNKLSKKIYVEIALKDDDKRRVISKWKLLNTLASMKGGKLYLLAPKGHKAFTQRILKSHDLSHAQLVYLN